MPLQMEEKSGHLARSQMIIGLVVQAICFNVMCAICAKYSMLEGVLFIHPCKCTVILHHYNGRQNGCLGNSIYVAINFSQHRY